MSSFDILSPNTRGINGALLDLEYQRMELLKFNLFDNQWHLRRIFSRAEQRLRQARKYLAAVKIAQGACAIRRRRRERPAKVLR